MLVEGLHAELAALLHDLLDRPDLALEDQVGDQRGVQHDLHRGHAPLARGHPDEALRHDAAQVQRQVHQQLRAPLLGEEVDDPVERLVGAVGVQRGQAEVAGLGERDRVVHRLAVADLADHDHVRGLSQRVLQRDLPALGVHAHLAMGHDAVAVRVHELHRVLDRHDVAVGGLVAVADHRRQRVRLARAGRAHDDDQSALGERELLEDRRQPQLLEGGDLHLDRAQHDADLALLHEGVHAEAADPGRADREVHLLVRLEVRRLAVVHQRARQLHRVPAAERHARDRLHLAVDLERGRELRGEEEVRAALAEHQPQQVVQELGGLFAFHVSPSLSRGSSL